MRCGDYSDLSGKTQSNYKGHCKRIRVKKRCDDFKRKAEFRVTSQGGNDLWKRQEKEIFLVGIQIKHSPPDSLILAQQDPFGLLTCRQLICVVLSY